MKNWKFSIVLETVIYDQLAIIIKYSINNSVKSDQPCQVFCDIAGAVQVNFDKHGNSDL